jgi:hypothetical protein
LEYKMIFTKDANLYESTFHTLLTQISKDRFGK